MLSSTQVYTVGPEYAHAEARKSPSLDGKVERDSQGKEIRYPVILNQYEKELANKVCNLFKVLEYVAHKLVQVMRIEGRFNVVGKTKCNNKQLEWQHQGLKGGSTVYVTWSKCPFFQPVPSSLFSLFTLQPLALFTIVP